MIVKLSQIINSQEELKKLLDFKLPVKTAYNIGKMINKIQPELKAFEEVRVKLIKELGEQKGEDGNWEIKKENLQKFTEEIEKVLNSEISLDFNEVDKFQKISIDQIGEEKIEASLLLKLDWLFE